MSIGVACVGVLACWRVGVVSSAGIRPAACIRADGRQWKGQEEAAALGLSVPAQPKRARARTGSHRLVLGIATGAPCLKGRRPLVLGPVAHSDDARLFP